MRICNHNKVVLLFIIFLVTIKGYAQFSKTHYIPPVTAHIDSNTSLPQEQYLYVSTPTTTSFNVKITPVGGVPVNLTISNTTPIEYIIREKTAGENNFTGMFSQLITPSNTTGGKFNNLGYIIEAESQVYASVRILAGTNYEQGGALVSKGLAGLGTIFRVGALPTLIKASDQSDFINGNAAGKVFSDFLSFVSIMATEDNTTVDFSDFSPGVSILNNTPTSVNLNSKESYIVVLQNNEKLENFDGLIGVLVNASKPIAVNCGSFNGTNHDNKGSRDIGIDQIVPIERIGQEYIFVKARGNDDIEKPLIVAHQDNTDIFIDGGAVPIATLNAGEYHVIDGSLYGADGNMYVNASNDVYAYQGIGGIDSNSNQGLFFVPPLNCKTPKIVDNIPYVKHVGQLGVIDIYESDGITIKDTRDVSTFDAGLAIITETGSTLTVNGTNIMALGVPVIQQPVAGNSAYETYYIENLPASIINLSIVSTGQLYVASFGANSRAALGGFYSGFEFKPEIILTDTSLSNFGTCIPNVELSLNDISYYDTYQWYLDGIAISGANSINYTPTTPGYYYVEGEITGCQPAVTSDIIPVSMCPSDGDNDGVNDNMDVDNDNDGILNCAESYGSETLDLTNPLVGSINSGSISFTGTIVPPAASTYITGFSDGHFNSNVPVNENLEYQLDFSNQVNILFEYATTGTITSSNDESFTVMVPSNKTITLLDPDDQLLIDTDYDGIYETGVTEFSSFDIRFKIKNNSLAIGTGTFGFYSHTTNALTFKHKNETLTATNSNISFKIIAACISLDSDNDGFENALDLDSDNDGIPDIVEASGRNIVISNMDTNQDGFDDVFTNTSPINSDIDGVPNYLDLDSDNDGIYDLEESGSGLPDLDFDGVVDNANTIIGSNGWVDTAETTPDSGLIGYTVLDTDMDTLFNYFDFDSDSDGCPDVTEAGFTDGEFGEIVSTGFDTDGVALGSDGYTTPNPDYLIFKTISIITEPTDQLVCELGTVSLDIVTDAESLQWQFFDGTNWIDIIDDVVYSGATSSTLIITKATITLDGSQYRVQLNSTGNSCGLRSLEAVLTVNQTAAPTGNTTQSFCAVTSATLADIVVTGTNIIWYADPTTTSPLPDSTPITVATTYYASQTITGCESNTRLAVFTSVSMTPDITNPGPQVECDSFILSGITGPNLSGGEAYFDASQASGGTLLTGPITTTQTVWIYDANGSCNDEESFLVTINTTPAVPTGSKDQDFCSDLNPTIADFSVTGTTIQWYNNATSTTPLSSTLALVDNASYFATQTSNGCESISRLEVIVTINHTPEITNPGPQVVCDSFILSEITGPNLSGGEAYYDASQASGGTLLTGYITTTQTVWIYDANGSCNDEESFLVTINKTPIADSLPDVTRCDSYTLPVISLGNQYFTGSGGAGTEYFANDILTSSQTIYIYAAALAPCVFDENPVAIQIIPSPKFTVNSGLICSTTPGSTIDLIPTIDSPSGTYDYFWEAPDGSIYTTETLMNVSLSGDYYLTISKYYNATDYCSSIRTLVEVNTSEKPNITLMDITVQEFSNNNTITIDTTNLGVGDYEFSLDEKFGSFQDAPYFENISYGMHTLWVNDKNECGNISIDVVVAGYPKFFTPNGDANHPTWQVFLPSETVLAGTKIFIYDRYGKLLKQLDPRGAGWDGTFNGTKLSSDDYWFQMSLEDGRVFNSHFTLKR